jgi:ABC-2 type transport system permease protein
VSTAGLIVHQSRYDLRVFARDPRARGFTLAMPVLLLLLFGYLFRHDTFTEGSLVIKGDVYYVPRMIVLEMAGVTLSNLLITLINKRETGALKRRRATPVQPVVLISGDIVTCIVSTLGIAIVVTIIGWAFFSVHPSGIGLLAMVLTVLVGAISLSAVAYAMSPAVNSVASSGPVTMLIAFVLNALSGIYVPESLFPAWLRDVALVFPIRPLAVAMQAAFDPATNGGRTFAWPDLGIVVVWGIVAGVIATRRFTWAPLGHQ